MDLATKQNLEELVTRLERAGRVWDDSQQSLQEAQNDALHDEVKALKALVVALTKAVLLGS